jgi:hypothetical protein
MRWYYWAIRRAIEEDYKKVSSFQVILTICSTVGIFVIGTCSCLRACIDMTQDSDRGQALVNVVINLRFP